MSRLLVFNFDGTMNGRDDESATNVLRFHDALSLKGQVSFYYAGPGNEDENNLLNQLLGAAFGTGCRDIRDAAYEALCSVYRHGDRIAVTGFSRGAAIARLFCTKVISKGINGDWTDIEFLGVWDTVFARLPIGRFQQSPLFSDLTVPKMVVNARHAVALDEDRVAFAPNLMNKRPGIVEMWFRGNHSDVGGGYVERGLADISLNWMMDEAKITCGIDFDHGLNMMFPTGVHRETLPFNREDRKVGVIKDGQWSGIQPLMHSSVN